MPKISVIIPNYNGEKYINACLRGVFSQTYRDFEVIVVDNGSMDHSIDIIQKEFPEVKPIFLQENLGVSEGINQGIKIAQGAYIALLHNDAVPNSNWLEAMHAMMEADDTIFSVSPLILQASNPQRIDSAGWGYTLFGLSYPLYQGKNIDRVKLKNRRVFAACGCAALYRRSMLHVIGGFDREFYAYLEDVDVGWRAMLFGYKNVFCEDAIVKHIGSGTIGTKYNDFKARLCARNNIYMLYKNMSMWQHVMCKPFMLMSAGHKKQVYGKKELKRFYKIGIAEANKSKKNIYKVRYTKKRGKRQFYTGLLLIKYSILYPFIGRAGMGDNTQKNARKF